MELEGVGSKIRTCEQETQGKAWRPSQQNHQTDRYHWCKDIYQKQQESQRAEHVPLQHPEHAQPPASDIPEYPAIPVATAAIRHSSHSSQVARAGQDMYLDG